MNENFSVGAVRVKAVRKMYELPQAVAPVTVSEYLITEVNGQKCCFIKFIKNIKAPIDSMTYEVTSLDMDGEEVGVQRVSVPEELIPLASLGRDFSPNRAVSVALQCQSVRVRILEVVSGAYTYIADGSKMRAEYDIPSGWRQDEKLEKKLSRKKGIKRNVYSKRGKKPKRLALLTVIFALLIIIVVLSPFLVRLLRIDWFREYFGYFG